MPPAFKNHRPRPCRADSPNHAAAVADSQIMLHMWHIHTGTARLYIVGPGQNAWLACSESCYSGQIGTADEWAVARRALAILTRDHLEDKDAGPAEIRAALERARLDYVKTNPPASHVVA